MCDNKICDNMRYNTSDRDDATARFGGGGGGGAEAVATDCDCAAVCTQTDGVFALF